MSLFFRERKETCIFHLLELKFDVCLGIAVDGKSKRKNVLLTQTKKKIETTGIGGIHFPFC